MGGALRDDAFQFVQFGQFVRGQGIHSETSQSQEYPSRMPAM
jgi:hypothetical protein